MKKVIWQAVGCQIPCMALAEGAEIEVSAPTGNFYLIDPNKRNVFIQWWCRPHANGGDAKSVGDFQICQNL